MSNLAYQPQRKPSQEPQKTYVKQPQKVTGTRGSRITKGEKVIWIAAALLLMAGATMFISKYATIYKINASIKAEQSNVNEIERRTKDLESQKKELSNPSRIIEMAKKEGMSFDKKRVKH
ncbi:cell division protein FtsL [Fictibacillus macauensis ZFHKF-1]|uniref:Cell division protein FtsL n=1 Tax=Fictibacillus macauensis ZFHKF-1 TaxID=1196324 RepID=I8AH42_9BACL|nr:cell division protein FtsL [Fictibacillus macauensis]EIT84987.1 cell division protein FtsL [Fictibacillus macauensis ZFHKF-1]